MKSPLKLQNKLKKLLAGTPALKVMPSSENGWTLQEWEEIGWIVQTFVNQNTEVVECDPLKDWLEEFHFFMAENKRNAP